MQIKNITEKELDEFNSIATHPLQSYEWGEFRKKTGIKVIRKGFYENNKIVYGFQLTIHKIPYTKLTIGYLPKINLPSQDVIEELIKMGKQERCIFIQLEPNVENRDKKLDDKSQILKVGNYFLPKSARPLFTKYTFCLDLTKTEDQLLSNMHSKTRYNIRIAQKHNVIVKEETSENAFNHYLELLKETTKRQGFFAHTFRYHELMWETLTSKNIYLDLQNTANKLTARLLVAYYKNIPLTAWILFIFHDTLYYPYGASSNLHRETMSSNLVMWNAILFGKKMRLKKFDMWGALGSNPNTKDPWYGFHRFKMGYNPTLIEFIGSYDLIINTRMYWLYKLANKLRWFLLKLKK